MNISLRQLRAFLAVAESRNFSRAGELMALTQPAVSRNVTELEQALGVQLLHRTTREVELTDAGRLLQGHATRVLDALDECLLEVSGLATQRLGKVRVASSPTLSAHLMPRCIARCREQAPGIELLLLDRIQSDVLQSVRSGEVDFGVVIDPQGRDDLHCETILSEPFCLVCPATHRLARKRHADQPAHAGAHPIQLFDRRLRMHLGQQGQHVGCVKRHLVGGRILQPVAFATPDHVGADHAGAFAEPLGQHVEVTPLARQAVHADHDMGMVRIAGAIPFPIGHAVRRIILSSRAGSTAPG